MLFRSRTPARSLFSIGAQDYLVSQGARVAPMVAARDGQLFVVNEGRIWMVTDWIEGLAQATKVDLEGAAALCYGLGEFHRLSQGYMPPPGAKKASRLYRWPKTYQKILNKIDWFRQIATAYAEMPASQTLYSLCDMFAQQARDAIARLEASPYASLVERGEPAWGIVHQDYGWSNGQIGPGGIWIIDLDGVAYDLPIRDLRKLITSTMDDMGVWDVTWMRGMIDAYNQANPIEPELYQVLLIDMALPNEFYKHTKEGVTKTTIEKHPGGLTQSGVLFCLGTQAVPVRVTDPPDLEQVLSLYVAKEDPIGASRSPDRQTGNANVKGKVIAGPYSLSRKQLA